MIISKHTNLGSPPRYERETERQRQRFSCRLNEVFFSRIFKLAAVQFAPLRPDSKLTMAQAVTKILPKCSNHLILSSTILNLHPILDCQAYCMTNLIKLKETKHLPRVLGFKSGISNSLNSQNIYTKSGGAAAPGN